MSSEIDSQSRDNPKSCGWCGILLGSANLISKSTCIRCYKMLIAAGLTDKEIFSGETGKAVD